MTSNESIGILVVIVLLSVYLTFTLCPSIFPATIWTNKHVRKLNRVNKRVVESIVPHSDQNVVDRPVRSYYKKMTAEKYGENAVVVGLHYTDWCGYCKRMKPIWEQVKESLKDHTAVVMVENDEDKNPTPGIDAFPTIYKMRNGKLHKYNDRADFNSLRQFILSTSAGQTYGAAW